jgi:DMSO/TMAO reductase YedYZ molybdopterin-dependent catalytic subunit
MGNLISQAARRELEAEIQATGGVPVPSGGAGATATDVAANGTIPVVERLPFGNIDDPVMAVPGTRDEYTPVEKHYDVSLRTRGTEIDGNEWTLDITGLVPEPVSLSIAELRRDFEAHSRFVTLSCISGPVGSRLMSTTQWTGLSVQDLLERIQPFESARYLDFTCADGFHEIVDIQQIRNDERIMLCYAWDGEPLPIDHGFPLRIWLPDRYGMKQPRWIESIEITDKYREGYWVKRGWDEVARIKPTSAVDTVAKDHVYEVDGQSFVPIGGIAFAGTRGISQVEVRVDEGEWQVADLRAPLSDSTWVVWRYDWPFDSGLHNFEVRCVTGGGERQAEDNQDVRPSGATGIHSVLRRL